MNRLLIIVGILCVLLVSGCAEIFGDSRSEIYCNYKDSVCMDKFKEDKAQCTDSVITIDSAYTLTKYKLRKKGDYCEYYMKILGTNVARLKGTTLTCNIPLSKMKEFSTTSNEMAYFKYCEGDFIEAINQAILNPLG